MYNLSALDAAAASSAVLLFRKKVTAAREQSIESLWASEGVHDRHARSSLVAGWWKSVVVSPKGITGSSQRWLTVENRNNFQHNSVFSGTYITI